ncbi:heat shock protein beta-1-like [Amphibalanus amphitrite]|uniref:heat shock protein beta-1-like n=1 Tax=Amphibalanus amphitrite TaxID=1232801 RepID=UPI001C905AF7|nr:heat shock protein beta-1-like [Amphibalanus amphitrite]
MHESQWSQSRRTCDVTPGRYGGRPYTGCASPDRQNLLRGSWSASDPECTTSQQQSGFPGSSLAPRSDPSTWLDNLNSPLIQDEGDQKQLKLRFDVSQYKPEEIVVKTVDNKLLVHAKHEEKSDSRSVYREYNREFLLPQGSNPEMIKSSLSKDGILTVEAPLPALEGGSGHIPITHQ